MPIKNGTNWAGNREAAALQQLSKLEGNEVDGPANLSCDTTPSPQAAEINVATPAPRAMEPRRISAKAGKTW